RSIECGSNESVKQKRSPSGIPVVAMLVFATFCARPISAQSGATASGYVDGRVCAQCHRQIAEDYSRTGMGRSFFRPSPANTLETYSTETSSVGNSIYHAASGTHYSMTVRGGQYYQRRWQTGFDGKEANVEEMRIDYVLGSGNHARSYLHRTA